MCEQGSCLTFPHVWIPTQPFIKGGGLYRRRENGHDTFVHMPMAQPQAFERSVCNMVSSPL